MGTPEGTDRLTETVRRYGRAVLTDPVALRAALRETGASFTEPERDALAAVAGSAELTELLTGGTAHDPADAVADRIAETTELPADRVRWAWATVTAALDRPGEPPTRPAGESTLPPKDPTAREFHVTWEGEPVAGTAESPARARGALFRRGWWLAGAAVVVVAALTAGGAVWLRHDSATASPPPDRYAVDQVALRYRALGAKLLDGVEHCAQLPARPGELERVGCAFGTYSLTLATYDASSRLHGQADSVEKGDSFRTLAGTHGGATLVMKEDKTGRSTMYWDVDSPRPVSATLTADKIGLPILAEFYDTRRFGGLKRPRVPGAAFNSGVLWDFAEGYGSSAHCASLPEESPAGEEITEMVDCPQPDGSDLMFALAANRDALKNIRADYAHDAGKVPGSVKVSGWNINGGPLVGQSIQFVRASDDSPGIYFDDDASLAYGVFRGVAGTPLDALVTRWRRGGS